MLDGADLPESSWRPHWVRTVIISSLGRRELRLKVKRLTGGGTRIPAQALGFKLLAQLSARRSVLGQSVASHFNGNNLVQPP